MICSYLNAKNHPTIGVTDGRNGLHMIKQKNFDIVLLDLTMPEYSGYDMIDDLVKNDLIQDNQIAVLTASSISVEEEEKLIQKGIKLVLRKPIDPDEMITHLMSLLSGK